MSTAVLTQFYENIASVIVVIYCQVLFVEPSPQAISLITLPSISFCFAWGLLTVNPALILCSATSERCQPRYECRGR